MELKSLKDYLELKMQKERRENEKTRFKFVTTEGDNRLIFYIKNKYKSDVYKQNFIQESAMLVYDKDGKPIITRDFSGDRVVSFDDIKNDIKDFTIEDSVFPSGMYFTEGNLPRTKSLYLAKVGVESHLRGQKIGSMLITDFEKYAQVNEYDMLYGHGCAFGEISLYKRTMEENNYIKEIIQKYKLGKVSEEDKNLILFYAKKGYFVDGSISRYMGMREFPFAFSKKIEHDKIILPHERLFLKESKNKFDGDKILLS